MDYLRTTEAELGIDLNRPLSEQDPLDRLNGLANKKESMLMIFTTSLDLTKGSSHQFNMKIVQLFESLKFLQRQLFRSLEDWEVSSLQFMQRYRN
ncbi:hypothetical protein Tco_1007414 [Tanacetum coccineum]